MNICKAKDSELSLTSVRWVETNQSRTCQAQFEIKKTKVLDWLSQSANLTQHHLMILLNKRKTFWSLNVLTLPLKNCTTILKGKTNHPDFLNQPVLYQDRTMLLWICNNLKQRSFLIKSSISYKKWARCLWTWGLCSIDTLKKDCCLCQTRHLEYTHDLIPLGYAPYTT